MQPPKRGGINEFKTRIAPPRPTSKVPQGSSDNQLKALASKVLANPQKYLFQAIEKNDFERLKIAVDLLKENGKQIHCEGPDGISVLHKACEKGDVETVRFLMDSGVINTLDRYGNCATEYALRSGKPELVQFLIKNGSRTSPEALALIEAHQERQGNTKTFSSPKQALSSFMLNYMNQLPSSEELAIGKDGNHIIGKEGDVYALLKTMKVKPTQYKLYPLIEKSEPVKTRVKGSYTYPDGSQYQGEMVGGVPNGKGIKKYNDGSIYEGEFKGGIKHGKGQIHLKGGTASYYEGDFENGKLTGSGRIEYRNGNIYEGQVVDGRRHGTGTLSFPDGSIVDVESYQGVCVKARIKNQGSKEIKQRNLENKKGVPLGFEGTHQAIAMEWMKEALEETLKESVQDEPELKAVLHAANNSTHYAKALDDIDRTWIIEASKNSPQIIHGGWDGHAVSFVLSGDDLLICNRGLGSLSKTVKHNELIKPIAHLKIKDAKDKFKALLLIKKAHDSNAITGEDLVNNRLKDKKFLPSVEVQNKSQEDSKDPLFKGFYGRKQHIGNCAVYSPQASLYVVLLLECRKSIDEEYGDSLDEDKKALLAQSKARQLYKKSFSSQAMLARDK